MKKLLIVNYYFKFGGISTSLENLLNNIDREDYAKVDLFLLNPEIDEKYKIPENINIISPKRLTRLFFSSFSLTLKEGTFIDKVLVLFLIIISTIFGYENISKLVLFFENSLKGYDIAISYSNDIYYKKRSIFSRKFSGGCNYFVHKKVESSYKIGWIHNEPEKLGLDYKICKRTYKDFDYVVNVSMACKKQFDSIIPIFTDKSLVVNNTFVVEKLENLAEGSNPYDNDIYDHKKILTVARLDNQQKRIDKVLFIVEGLLASNINNFTWYIIGDGPDYNYLLEECKKRNIYKYIIFLGKKNNPYIYMKHADLFVLTSDYEAQGMVITESLILNLPVLSTNFPASYEFIDDGVVGKIVEKDELSLLKEIKLLLKNPDSLEKMRQNLEQTPSNNYFKGFKKLIEDCK